MKPTTDEIRQAWKVTYIDGTPVVYGQAARQIGMLCDEVDRLRNELADIASAADADKADLEVPRDGTKLTRHGVVQALAYWKEEHDKRAAEVDRLREALDRLYGAAEVYSADQSRSTDARVGRVQPVSVADAEALNAALRQAREVLYDE